MAHALSITSAWYEERWLEKIGAIKELRDADTWATVLHEAEYGAVDSTEAIDVMRVLRDAVKTIRNKSRY